MTALSSFWRRSEPTLTVHAWNQARHRVTIAYLFRRAIAGDFATRRVAIVTEMDQPDLRRSASEAGAEAFVAKPDLLALRDLTRASVALDTHPWRLT